MRDYVGALENLEKAHVLEPNDASILKIHEYVKKNMEDYVGALEDLDNVNIFEPNDAFILIMQSTTNFKLKKYQIALETFNFILQSIIIGY